MVDVKKQLLEILIRRCFIIQMTFENRIIVIIVLYPVFSWNIKQSQFIYWFNYVLTSIFW